MQELGSNGVAEGAGVLYRRVSVSDGSVYTQEQFIARKRLYGARGVPDYYATTVISRFYAGKYGVALLAFTPTPGAVEPFLRARVGHCRFAATIYTNHVYMLT